MKKIISVLLMLVMVLGLAACGSDGSSGGSTTGTQTQAAGFQVGFGRVDISPYEQSVPLSGYGNTSTRMSDGIADILYITCVAFTDEEGETVLMFTADLTGMGAMGERLREAVSEETGIPVDHIMISATHTHSAPDTGNTSERSITSYYQPRLLEWTVKAATTALADRKPATMEMATTVTENMNFIRHYTVSDGSTVGENYGLLGDRTYVSHCHTADGTMQLLRFTREGGQDVVLVNWQAHPTRYGKTTNASADFISPLRTRMEEKLGCLVAYYSGASGNINLGSRITSEMRSTDYAEIGEILADYAIEALENTTPVSAGNVQALTQTVTTDVDHSEDSRLSDALVVRNLWTTTNDMELSMAKAAEYGMGSQWHAAGIITRQAMGGTISMDISVLSIGDVAFVCAPYEMFDQNGIQIRDGSPFAMTFIATLCNASNGYIASRECAEHGCYGYDSRKWGTIGSAEELVSDYVGMLETLYETK